MLETVDTEAGSPPGLTRHVSGRGEHSQQHLVTLTHPQVLSNLTMTQCAHHIGGEKENIFVSL